MKMPGSWSVRCESDPRWNGDGKSPSVGEFVMPQEARDHLAAKKLELGVEPPRDCEWSYMKD